MPVLAASHRQRPAPIPSRSVLFLFCGVGNLAIAIHFGAEYHSERATLQSLKRPPAPASTKPGTTPLPAQPEVPQFGPLFLHLIDYSKESMSCVSAAILPTHWPVTGSFPARPGKIRQVLAEMAAIYESIQLYDRSNETWRKIQDLGPPPAHSTNSPT